MRLLTAGLTAVTLMACAGQESASSSTDHPCSPNDRAFIAELENRIEAAEGDHVRAVRQAEASARLRYAEAVERLRAEGYYKDRERRDLERRGWQSLVMSTPEQSEALARRKAAQMAFYNLADTLPVCFTAAERADMVVARGMLEQE